MKHRRRSNEDQRPRWASNVPSRKSQPRKFQLRVPVARPLTMAMTPMISQPRGWQIPADVRNRRFITDADMSAQGSTAFAAAQTRPTRARSFGRQGAAGW